MTRSRLDAVDLRILAEVQREGRITKLALAERVGLSPTPCWNRLKRLEDEGLIAGYHARISPKKVGPIAVVFMEVTLANHRQNDFDRFETAARAVPEIVGCWSLGGGIDYLLKVVARDIDAYQRLVDRLLDRNIGIDKYFTYIVTREVKDGRDLPIDRLFDPE